MNFKVTAKIGTKTIGIVTCRDMDIPMAVNNFAMLAVNSFRGQDGQLHDVKAVTILIEQDDGDDK